ncbi:uncharacterized protein LOC126370008 isoform X2 [Pectinophora gossypiella]|uniref:uncharacterized protein LOC126370008 isoform X2 n=1 Tax=Pectinophora gossypiella TaxID=13191 RepID=UPI00214F0801|nr:uncharacterized protein LOC126370008 isoform X2 [Pectinophora gossypiella]
MTLALRLGDRFLLCLRRQYNVVDVNIYSSTHAFSDKNFTEFLTRHKSKKVPKPEHNLSAGHTAERGAGARGAGWRRSRRQVRASVCVRRHPTRRRAAACHFVGTCDSLSEAGSLEPINVPTAGARLFPMDG